MKYIPTAVLYLLVFLAGSSGITKLMLMTQDVDFFGQFGFTNPLLMLFGAVQALGAVMLIFQKIRIAGTAIVAVTFIVSGVVLILAGSVPATVATLVALALLGWTIRNTTTNG